MTEALLSEPTSYVDAIGGSHGLTALEKSAVVLLSIGEDAAAEVMTTVTSDFCDSLAFSCVTTAIDEASRRCWSVGFGSGS